MTAIDQKTAVDRLREANSFLLTTHEHPDGDAIGTMLGLRGLLLAMGKRDIVCVSHDGVPRLYDWLPGRDAVKKPAEVSGRWDLAVIVDVAQIERIGDAAKLLASCGKVLVLDHHLETSPCGDYNFIVATYSAAAEIIIDLHEAAGVAMTKDTATCLYVGLTTDTGGFRFANTNSGSHRRAAALLETGINVSDISTRAFDVLPKQKLGLLRCALDHMEVSASRAFAHTWISSEDMKATGASGEDAEGLVNYARNIEGVKVGFMARELDNGKVKISMRSRDGFNSAVLLKKLGGGGHAGAAGVTLEMSLEEARATVVAAVSAALGETDG